MALVYIHMQGFTISSQRRISAKLNKCWWIQSFNRWYITVRETKINFINNFHKTFFYVHEAFLI